MSISQLFHGLKSASKGIRRRHRRLGSSHRPPARGLRFEPLECREMLANFMVVNTDDAGAGH